MKNILLLFFAFISGSLANAQVTSLSENFNTTCPVGGHHPNEWLDFNIIPSTTPDGEWACSASGRDGTPGIQCTGYYGGVSHLDTAYLLTPMLNLSGYTGDIYLNFDTKTTDLAGKLSVIVSRDTAMDSVGAPVDLTAALMPVFGNGDISGWVTHQVNLDAFRTTGAFYIAFRYSSTTTSMTTWYIDNVNTTQAPLNVPFVEKQRLPLSLSANGSAQQITLFYDAPVTGKYNVGLYDMLGRELCLQGITTTNEMGSYTISGLSLPAGMYVVKMGNEFTYGIAKVIVP